MSTMDPTIQMTPGNERRILEIATAATRGDVRFGAETASVVAERVAEITRSEAADAWSVWVQRDDECLYTAITGNGPTSAANAELYAQARAFVLSYAEEVDRLRTIMRNNGLGSMTHPAEK